MKVQIYALTSVQDAIDTVNAGADLIGVVAGNDGIVVEDCTAETARVIFAAVEHRAATIALSLGTDVERIARMVAQSPVPVVLAGGLSPENVAEAVRVVRPWAVDSFTRTDRPGQRGVKDPERVRAFVENARAAAAASGVA